MAKMKKQHRSPAKRRIGQLLPDTGEVGIAQRLKKLRLHMRMTGPQMAEHIGISYPRWNNFERGYPLPAKVALQICKQIPDVTLDWLYQGHTRGMDREISREIERLRPDHHVE